MAKVTNAFPPKENVGTSKCGQVMTTSSIKTTGKEATPVTDHRLQAWLRESWSLLTTLSSLLSGKTETHHTNT